MLLVLLLIITHKQIAASLQMELSRGAQMISSD